jgi:putative FmdB family regulatory protein
MPIYEYKCQQCGAHLEVRQSVSDAPLTTCEKCHGRLEKQWSLSGFQFKGAGWYVTDYSRKGSNGNGSADKSSSGDSTETPVSASNPAGGGEKTSGASETKAAT